MAVCVRELKPSYARPRTQIARQESGFWYNMWPALGFWIVG